MHKLLARQLQRSGGSTDQPVADWAKFVEAVNSAYEQADADRLLLQRSLDLASQELMERFRQLQADVIERQRAGQQLEHSLSLLRATLDATTDGIVVVDGERRIVDSNRKFLDMWHIADSVIAQRDEEAILRFIARQVQDPERLVGLVSQLRVEPEGISDDVLHLTDGRIFERHSQPQWIAATSVGRVWSFRDVTAERRRAEQALRHSEEQLRQAQKMEAIGRLAGGVAHDFNNLLTAINGFSDLALARMKPTEPTRPYVEEIAKAGQRASALTSQLLAFGRRQVLQPEVLSLDVVVADMAKLLQRVIGEDIELTTTVDPDLGLVRADPGQVGQVILNLATNARDAMPRGGKLTIEAENVLLDGLDAPGHGNLRPGLYVVLRVCDTGMGIDARVLPHIFEPFFTTKDVGKGTGLGLSTVYGIVMQSGGDVEVSSTPGQGTTFSIYLPRHDEPIAPDPDRDETLEILVHRSGPAAPGTNGTETLLLVEDEAPVRELAATVLKAGGHSVLAAGDAEQALEILARHDGPVHLLLTDIVMPGMNGLDLAEHIVALRPATRVLYMSGYTNDVTLQRGLSAGGAAFLQKPFTPTALARKVREVLDTVVAGMTS